MIFCAFCPYSFTLFISFLILSNWSPTEFNVTYCCIFMYVMSWLRKFYLHSFIYCADLHLWLNAGPLFFSCCIIILIINFLFFFFSLVGYPTGWFFIEAIRRGNYSLGFLCINKIKSRTFVIMFYTIRNEMTRIVHGRRRKKQRKVMRRERLGTSLLICFHMWLLLEKEGRFFSSSHEINQLTQFGCNGGE